MHRLDQPLVEERNASLTDDDFKRVVARAHRVIAFYRPIFGLEHWRINVYHRRMEEQKAEVECWPEYREMSIDVNAFQLHFCDDTELEECLVHELGHGLVSSFIQMWPNVKEAGRLHLEEGLVTDLANAVLRAMRAGLQGAHH